MPTHHAKRRPLVVANARHSPSYGCALRLDRMLFDALLGHARKTLSLQILARKRGVGAYSWGALWSNMALRASHAAPSSSVLSVAFPPPFAPGFRPTGARCPWGAGNFAAAPWF